MGVEASLGLGEGSDRLQIKSNSYTTYQGWSMLHLHPSSQQGKVQVLFSLYK